ncbi:hypothetical protein ACFFSY_29530 [Paenibacillus aurantiacus]|uniref:P27 family phage terminase small subunit n=1 Tax=Paenibacillus aurantiacus TaxID=1936118 RepID=A0ABV5KYU5_9BACL
MAEKTKKTKEELAASRAKAGRKRKITLEEKRLRQIYEKIPKEQMAIADGLIRRAAFMRVTLEGYEDDLGDKGSVEMFSQSDKAAPYERERPVARLYNSLNSNYQKIIKQLTDLLPKPEEGTAGKGEVDDGFEDFEAKR